MGFSKSILLLLCSLPLLAQTNSNGAIQVSSVTPQFSQTNRVTVSSAGAQTITGTGSGSNTLAANFFSVGAVLRFDIKGFFATSNTPGGMNVNVKLGATSICSATITPPSASQSNATFSLEGQIVGITTGSGGTVACQWMFLLNLSSTTTPILLGDSTFSSPVTINTTTTQVFDVAFTWSAFSSGDSLTSVTYVLKTP